MLKQLIISGIIRWNHPHRIKIMLDRGKFNGGLNGVLFQELVSYRRVSAKNTLISVEGRVHERFLSRQRKTQSKNFEK